MIIIYYQFLLLQFMKHYQLLPYHQLMKSKQSDIWYSSQVSVRLPTLSSFYLQHCLSYSKARCLKISNKLFNLVYQHRHFKIYKNSLSLSSFCSFIAFLGNTVLFMKWISEHRLLIFLNEKNKHSKFDKQDFIIIKLRMKDQGKGKSWLIYIHPIITRKFRKNQNGFASHTSSPPGIN